MKESYDNINVEDFNVGGSTECINKRITVSVIVLVYNEENCLRKCIDSILNQTYKDLDVVLIDDGSTDSSLLICEEYARKDNRIVVINNEQSKGIVQGRKIGIKNAKGEYVIFVNSNDWIEPEMCEHLLNKSVNENCDAVFSNYYTVYNERKYENEIYGWFREFSELNVDNENRKDIIFEALESSGSIIGFHFLRIAKKEILFYAINQLNDRMEFGEDIIILLYLLQKLDKIVFINKCYYNKRYLENFNKKEKIFVDIFSEGIAFLRCFNTFCNKFNYSEEYRNLAFNITYYFIMLQYNMLKELKDNIEDKCIMRLKSRFNFSKDKSVILYGESDIVYNYYYNYKDKCNILCWVDKNYKILNEKIANKLLLKIEDPNNINNYKFDYILIGVLSEYKYENIRDKFIKEGIDENKILWEKIKFDMTNIIL